MPDELPRDRICRSSAKGCITPRRNELIDEAIAASSEFSKWCARLEKLHAFPAKMGHLDDRDAPPSSASKLGSHVSLESFGPLFIPVLPLMQPTESGAREGAAPPPALVERGDAPPAAPDDAPAAVSEVPVAAGVIAPLVTLTAPDAADGAAAPPLTLSADGMKQGLKPCPHSPVLMGSHSARTRPCLRTLT